MKSLSPVRVEAAVASASLHRRILLLDVDADRRELRAAALRSRGALVDSVAGGADAGSLWKPGTHYLVLIEFHGAGDDVHDFYRRTQSADAAQKFGFYTSEPPYLTQRPRGEEAAGTPGRYISRLHLSPAAAPGARFRVGVPEAARRIASIRPFTHVPQGATTRPPKMSFSEAVKTAERLLVNEP